MVLSLGLGLTLLVTLALIDGNLRRQISGSLPERAPNFFFVDIQGSEVDGFAALIGKQAPRRQAGKVPMLRGRIMALNGADVDKIEARRRKAPGCCAATAASPMRTAKPDNASADRGHMVADRTMPASRWSRSRPRRARRSA